jgi:cell division transport system ATP-binding protein
MIKFQNVTKIFETKNKEKVFALKNISFEIEKGEFVLIVGKSGAGKSTLLKLIFAEEKPTEGKIFFEGKDITKMKSGEISKLRREIGIVFQDYKLLPTKTAFENLTYVMEVIGFSDEEIKRDVPKVLEIVGLTEKGKSFPNELSAGEKQRLSIARALIHRPKVILADEPTGNLDPYNTLDILKIFQKIHEMGTTIVLATHNKEVVEILRKRVITLEKGEIVRDAEKGKFVI